MFDQKSGKQYVCRLGDTSSQFDRSDGRRWVSAMKSAVFRKTPNQHPTAVVLLLLSNHRLGRLRQGESCVKRSVV